MMANQAAGVSVGWVGAFQSWSTADSIAAIAVLIAILSFAFSLAQYLRARHQETIRALLGNKESVGYIAYRIGEGDGKFPRRAKRRKEILMALCLAAIFEGSGRSRTLLYRALCKGRRRYGDEVTGIIDDIESNFEAYAGLSKLEKGRKRLDQLRQALSDERCLSKTGTGTVKPEDSPPTNH